MAPIMAPVQAPPTQEPPQGHPPLPTDHHQSIPPPVQKKVPSPAPVQVQKPPIPQEHMAMVTAFDATVERCKKAASSQVSWEVCL